MKEKLLLMEAISRYGWQPIIHYDTKALHKRNSVSANYRYQIMNVARSPSQVRRTRNINSKGKEDAYT